jgi:hypothetical protein
MTKEKGKENVAFFLAIEEIASIGGIRAGYSRFR